MFCWPKPPRTDRPSPLHKLAKRISQNQIELAEVTKLSKLFQKGQKYHLLDLTQRNYSTNYVSSVSKKKIVSLKTKLPQKLRLAKGALKASPAKCVFEFLTSSEQRRHLSLEDRQLLDSLQDFVLCYQY